MPILGAHFSIAGGYYRSIEKAVAARDAAGLATICVQLFTKNNNQWRAKPILPEDVNAFQDARQGAGIEHTLSHASYLLNLASPDDELRQKSIDALVVEMERATMLGIPFVVFHPGSYTSSTEEEGIARIAAGIDEVHDRIASDAARMLLETTAGQGTNLGWRFEQLAGMLAQVSDAARVGICVDTCHIFAAGYELGTRQQYADTMQQFDDVIGLDRIQAFHLNDSKAECASRKDRHENIGRGHMGLEPFRFLLNDERMSHVPMYLETPKGTDEETDRDLDELNLSTLTALVSETESEIGSG